jgi:hypothetical protein
MYKFLKKEVSKSSGNGYLHFLIWSGENKWVLQVFCGSGRLLFVVVWVYNTCIGTARSKIVLVLQDLLWVIKDPAEIEGRVLVIVLLWRYYT